MGSRLRGNDKLVLSVFICVNLWLKINGKIFQKISNLIRLQVTILMKAKLIFYVYRDQDELTYLIEFIRLIFIHETLRDIKTILYTIFLNKIIIL